MKKITLLILLLATTIGFAQPMTSAPTPTRLSADVISIFSDTYTDVGSNFFPNWGQGTLFSSYVIPASSPANNVIKYSNLDYEGIEFLSPINAGTMTNLHFDIWTPDVSPIAISLIAGGENAVTLTPTLSGWNSYDLVLASDYPARDLTNCIQLKFEKPGFAYHAEVNSIYLDNIYFWKPAAPAGTPVIGAFSIPSKIVGDPSFNITAPTSDSPGAFSYTSSNLSVATISGSTVTIVGAGTSVITANQAPSAPFIAGSKTANFIVVAAPLVAAPTPPNRNPADVISLFSNSYSNITIDTWSAPWDDSDVADVLIAGNDTKKINFVNFLGVDFSAAGHHKDATAFTNFHMDFWTANPDLTGKVINPKFSHWGGGAGEVSALLLTYLPTQSGTWVSIDAPLSTFAGSQNRNDIAQFILTSNLGVVYVDNIYLYKGTPLANTSFEASKIKMYPNPASTNFTIDAQQNIEKISVYNLLGQEVISKNPSSTSVVLDVASLQVGVYVVKATINGTVSTSRIIKE